MPSKSLNSELFIIIMMHSIKIYVHMEYNNNLFVPKVNKDRVLGTRVRSKLEVKGLHVVSEETVVLCQ